MQSEYSVFLVYPSGRVEVSTWRDVPSFDGTPNPQRVTWQSFPNWSNLLTRRKPFNQPGPIKVCFASWM